MAEQVQAVLDSMVTPLRNLQERGVFSEDEIKAIVARRRNCEYLVKRRSVRKADFINYILQEEQLEKLRQLRMKQKKIAKNDAGDKHVVQHLHFLYSRLLRKFRSDVSLYLQYIEFCKAQHSYKTLGRIYAQALQVHPRNVGLWIEAASHEFFGEGSVANARVLLQRGLRVNASSQQLWLQYFLLELHNVQKLKGRREILQLEEKDEGDAKDASTENDADAVDSLAIPTVVYKNAIRSIPNVVEFRLQFLDQCGMFPSTEKLQDTIMESIAQDFGADAQAWIARAAYIVNKKNECSDGVVVGFEVDGRQDDDKQEPASKRQRTTTTSNKNPVLAVLEEAVEALPTAEMYTKSVQFLRSYMEQSDDQEEVQLFIHKLLIQARDKEIISSELVLEEADLLVQEGKLAAAIATLKDYALDKKEMEAVQVWLQWARLCAALSSSPSSNADMNLTASQVLEMALDRTPLYGKEQMLILLELFGALLMEVSNTNNDDGGEEDETESNKHEKLSQLFEKMLLLSAGTNTAPFENDDEPVFGLFSVATACLQYLRLVSSSNDTQHARKVYEQVLYRSNYGSTALKTDGELQTLKEFIDECIELEKKCSSSKKKKRRQRLGRLYDTAIKLFDDAVAPSLADSYRSRRDGDVRFS